MVQEYDAAVPYMIGSLGADGDMMSRCEEDGGRFLRRQVVDSTITE